MFVCVHYHPKSNEQIFLKFFLWVGSDQRNLGKDIVYILDVKNPEFPKVPCLVCFHCLWLSG